MVTTTGVERQLSEVEAAVAGTFEQAGATGFFHARRIDDGGGTHLEVAVRADEPVVTASVFKIPVLLEVTSRAAAGRSSSLTDRLRVRSGRRTTGPTGLSVMLDDVDVSIRDLAYLMMSVSDNTATDVLMEWVGGVAPINARLAGLGLTSTALVGDCEVLLRELTEDLGTADGLDDTVALAELVRERFADCRTLRPADTNRTTPREMTRLLQLLWTDRAGPAQACAECRRIMALQVWPHRLSSGFGDGVKVSGKTGTLPGIRNEVGVVEYPDGGRYAVAAFTLARSYAFQQPPVDASIGTAARTAVDFLRSGAGSS